jgi:hypothetical protein
MSAAFRVLVPALMTIALTAGVAALADNEATQADKPRQYRPLSINFPDSRGKRFFTDQVLPKLAANGCFTCHTPAPGDVHPAMQYEHLLPYLAMGQSATNNILMLKLANPRSFSPQQPEHVGGQRCATGDTEPCKSIQAWWRIEFRNDR